MNESKACGALDTQFHAQHPNFEVLGKEKIGVCKTHLEFISHHQNSIAVLKCNACLLSNISLCIAIMVYPHKPRLRSLLSLKKLNKRKLALLLS
jgi:hypothetical protein